MLRTQIGSDVTLNLDQCEELIRVFQNWVVSAPNHVYIVLFVFVSATALAHDYL